VRINADDENSDKLAELFADLEIEGLLDVPQICYYVSPVHGVDATPFGMAGVTAALEKLKGSYPNLLVSSAQSHSGDSILLGLLESAPFRLKGTYCGASANSYIFLPDGSISSCLESLGEEHNAIGHYSESGVTLGGKAYDMWINRTAARMPPCLDCRYCLVCAGGCPQRAMNRYGDIYTPDCDNLQESYPALLAEAAERYLTANRV
jgi:uncharacterized protein